MSVPVRPGWPVERRGHDPVRLRIGQGPRRRQRNHQRVHLAHRPQITFRRAAASESSIQLATKGGAIEITLDEQNSELKITVKGKVTFQADGDVEIKAGGSMKLEATGQMTVKGATVAIN